MKEMMDMLFYPHSAPALPFPPLHFPPGWWSQKSGGVIPDSSLSPLLTSSLSPCA